MKMARVGSREKITEKKYENAHSHNWSSHTKRLTTRSSNPSLETLPPELQCIIASHLDASSLATFRLLSKTLSATWIKDPPRMTLAEWKLFQANFEAYARRRRRSSLPELACSMCNKLVAKELFGDAQSRKSLGNGRMCIACAIRKGSYDVCSFTVKGIKSFGCRGCRKAKPLDEEAAWREGCCYSRGARWCKGCWAVINNYAEAGLLCRD